MKRLLGPFTLKVCLTPIEPAKRGHAAAPESAAGQPDQEACLAIAAPPGGPLPLVQVRDRIDP
jgi:hypothetical protein